jgi:4-diphosphocytidyl-2-C-methyl-D-erythritol kinase
VTATIVETAPAKINLALAVTGRRPDGYHLLDTIAVFSDIGDRIEVAPADTLSLEITGPFASGLSGLSDNLVTRAAGALCEAAFGEGSAPGTDIRLDKQLPVASGIGGGSADAAATLRALNRLWRLDWTIDRLADVGIRVGADVPMCLVSRPLRARGIGEDIAPLPVFPALPLVLVNPGVAVSTAAVFAELAVRRSPALPGPTGIADIAGAVAYLGGTVNDLEAPALRIAPGIDNALNALRASPGCLLARMSGSGATCFGIFRNSPHAKSAETRIASAEAGWWVRATTTAAA